MAVVHSFTGITPPARFDEIAWAQVRVESAEERDGDYDEVDTLDLDPVDVYPASPRVRGFTVTGAEGWYRLVFLDEDGNSSPPTAPINLPEDSSPGIDAVRLKIGDTDSAAELLDDDAILAALAAWPDNVDLAAADCAEAIAAKYARDFNFSTDGQSFNRRERVLHYMELAKTLRRAGFLLWPS